MNDRYLFKAKRKNWVELPKEEWWVVGLLTKMWGQLHIINPNDENTAYPIDESTICQCTGRKDEWEHDVFEFDGERYEVVFDEYLMSWDSSVIIGCENIALGEFNDKKYRKLGKSIDNPELLEVE